MEINSKESSDMNDAPPLELNNYLYNCTECSSNIEIISLDENKIKFKCCNNHNIEIEIKEYLKRMKQYNNIKLNDDKCDKHKKEYLSYCFDCNIHLCNECLKTREHSYHYKIIILEIEPKNEIAHKIRYLINDNKIKINKLKKSKKEKENILDNILTNNIKKIEEKKMRMNQIIMKKKKKN